MSQVEQDRLYTELLRIDERLEQSTKSFDELVALVKQTNRELAEGQARTNALKRKLFGDRFDASGAIRG